MDGGTKCVSGNLQVEGAGGTILPAIINSLKKSQVYL